MLLLLLSLFVEVAAIVFNDATVLDVAAVLQRQGQQQLASAAGAAIVVFV